MATEYENLCSNCVEDYRVDYRILPGPQKITYGTCESCGDEFTATAPGRNYGLVDLSLSIEEALDSRNFDGDPIEMIEAFL